MWEKNPSVPIPWDPNLWEYILHRQEPQDLGRDQTTSADIKMCFYLFLVAYILYIMMND